MSDIKMSHTEAFNKWYSERMGHPFAVQLGKSAVDELQQENAELREFAAYCQGFLGCEESIDSMALHSITLRAKELLNKNDN